MEARTKKEKMNFTFKATDGMQEIWKPIKEYEGLYEISNLGRVKSLPRLKRATLFASGKEFLFKTETRILKPTNNRNLQKKTSGYPRVPLYKNKLIKNLFVHRLVGFAFIPNPKNSPQINHKNCNKLDNRAENLEWCTQSENMLHAYKTLKDYVPSGTGKFGRDSNKATAVFQKTIEGKLIKKWLAISETKKLGFTGSGISACCGGRQKTHKGYIWEYV